MIVPAVGGIGGGKSGGMNGARIALGGFRGLIGAMSMTGARTLASEFGLLTKGTPPERVAEEGVPQVLRPVSREMRPATVDLLHLGYGSVGGAAYGMLPDGWRRRWYSGPLFGIVLWFGYFFGIAPLLGLRIERRREAREWAVLAADHLLYGLVVSRLGRSGA
jgi:hypothetical protein